MTKQYFPIEETMTACSSAKYIHDID